MSDEETGMHVGVCRIYFRIPENDSLKGKRRVLQSIFTRIRAKFNVAIAEIGEQDVWQTAIVGITCVSNEGRHANSQLSNVMTEIYRMREDIEVVDYQTEIIDL